MSRSIRKTPIYGIAAYVSEKVDKKIWHRRWRSKEHARLACSSVDELESHLTLVKDEVSCVWGMSKDGRRYWPVKSQQQYAQWYGRRHGKTQAEVQALEQRMLHRIAAK